MEANSTMRAKLIFNPTAGIIEESPVQLIDVLNELQNWDLVPEAYLVEPGSDPTPVIQDALQRGFRMFVVCGGDGTIENVAGTLAGTSATLGIIPTGTRNNVALSLGIPEDIPTAASLLRNGQRIIMDVGLATCGNLSRLFLETCSVGLLSALFSAADEIQHGNITRIGDLLATLVSFPLAEMHLVMNTEQEIRIQGHEVLIANLPYVGPHYHIAPENSFNDGLLDVLVFPDLSKLELLGNIFQIAGDGLENTQIQRYRAQKVAIDTKPLMPVMADGVSLGEGPVQVTIQQRSLAVMANGIKPVKEPYLLPIREVINKLNSNE